MATNDLMLKQEEQRGCDPASRDTFKVCLVAGLYIYLIHFLAISFVKDEFVFTFLYFSISAGLETHI